MGWPAYFDRATMHWDCNGGNVGPGDSPSHAIVLPFIWCQPTAPADQGTHQTKKNYSPGI